MAAHPATPPPFAGGRQVRAHPGALLGGPLPRHPLDAQHRRERGPHRLAGPTRAVRATHSSSPPPRLLAAIQAPHCGGAGQAAAAQGSDAGDRARPARVPGGKQALDDGGEGASPGPPSPPLCPPSPQVSSSLSAKQREVKAREEELEKREAALAAADARMREREAALTARITEVRAGGEEQSAAAAQHSPTSLLRPCSSRGARQRWRCGRTRCGGTASETGPCSPSQRRSSSSRHRRPRPLHRPSARRCTARSAPATLLQRARVGRSSSRQAVRARCQAPWAWMPSDATGRSLGPPQRLPPQSRQPQPPLTWRLAAAPARPCLTASCLEGEEEEGERPHAQGPRSTPG